MTVVIKGKTHGRKLQDKLSDIMGNALDSIKNLLKAQKKKKRDSQVPSATPRGKEEREEGSGTKVNSNNEDISGRVMDQVKAAIENNPLFEGAEIQTFLVHSNGEMEEV